jgi:hypothetical protein
LPITSPACGRRGDLQRHLLEDQRVPFQPTLILLVSG